jgi:outer membrane protein assembly factor BamA
MSIHKVIIVFFLLMIQFTATSQVTVSKPQDSLGEITIEDVIVQDNKKTKDYIILRELVVKKNDIIPFLQLEDDLDRSQKNIFNTTLFNEVRIDAVKSLTDGTKYTIFISVKERWYIFPAPIFELYDRNYKEWRKVYDSDINRVRYGMRFSHNNFSGRRDVLRVNVITGFSKDLLISYSQPFADKELKQGFGASISYAKRIGVSYIDSLNAGLPRKLCGNCPGPNNRLFESNEYNASAGYNYRKGLYASHAVGIGYTSTRVSDTIVKLNKNYFAEGIAKTNFLSVSYNYNYSKLDYFAYPLVGLYYKLGARSRFSKDALNQWMVYGFAGKYIKLAKKLYFSSQISASAKLNETVESFYTQKTSNLELGNIRGLEEYLFFSTMDISSRNNLRYEFLNRKFKSPILAKYVAKIPVRLFLRAYADGAYAHFPFPNYSVLNNKFLRTGGFGIDLVTLYDITLKMDFRFDQFGRFSINFR